MTHLLNSDSISHSQHGFVPKRSCLTNLLEAEEWITRIMDNGETTDVVFLDFAKAFDSVNHRLLLYKFQAYGVHPLIVQWVGAFLADRTSQVQVSGQLSGAFSVASGVPQGSVLGPLLFLVFVNDLPDAISQRVLLFADDVKLIAPRSEFEQLRQCLHQVWRWSNLWDLRLNVSKCSHLSIGAQPQSPLDFEPGRLVLDGTSQIKDLGVVVDSSFKPTAQCIQAANKARRVLFLIYRSFATLTVDIFTPLYVSLVRPILEYGVQACSPYLARDIQHLERVQRLATRMVQGLRGLPYDQRCAALKLQTLEIRRLRGDLILKSNQIKYIGVEYAKARKPFK